MTIQRLINLGAGSPFIIGTLPVVNISPGSQDQVLVTNGGVPAWSQITSNNIFASTIPISKLAPGSNNQVLMTDGIADFFGQISDGYVSSSANIAGSKIAGAGISTFGVIKLNGDLGGTAALPTVIGITGSAGIVTLNLTTVQYLDTITAPIFKQLATTSTSTTGQPLTIRSQYSTGAGSVGGDLILDAGDGDVANAGLFTGSIFLKLGGFTKLTVQPDTITVGLTNFIFADTVFNPTIRQLGTIVPAATGRPMTIQSQSSTGDASSTGGDMYISSGTGGVSSKNGNIFVQSGGTTIATVDYAKFGLNKGFRRHVTSITNNYTVLITDDIIAVGTLSAGITITLPASPVLGDVYEIKDTAGTASVKNITIGGNGHNIDGISTFLLNEDRGSLTVFYNSATEWSVI